MSWDDGKHQKVKSVRLTFDDVINSIEVEYEGTNLQSQRRGTLGTKSDGFTLSLDEYITELTGYYKTTFSGDVITALTFKSNKKTYGTYGNKTRSYFSATAPGNNQIAGFFGTSGNALNSIEVHFAPIPPRGSIQPKPVDPDQPKPVDPDQPKPVDPDQPKPVDPDQPKPVDPDQPKPVDPDQPKPVSPAKKGPVGGSKGNTFDDGVFDGVKKVTVGVDEFSVTYIKIEYEKDGNVITREHGAKRGELKEFSVNYPKENITGVGGSFDHIFTYDTTLITSLYFTLSNGFTSPKFGETKGTEFKHENNGGKLVGFHGRGEHAIDAIGAYFDNNSKSTGPETNSESDTRPVSPGKIEAVGGIKGNTFDDGVFDGVKKVTVGVDEFSVTYIKIEYEKDGNVITREHGTKRGELKEFSVDYPKENITAVGGSYDHIFTYDTKLVTSLYFTLSNGFTSPKFGETKGTEFKLEGQNGGKLVGFHGCGEHAIDAIGAYFDNNSKSTAPETNPVSPGKIEPVGGIKGNTFDDGVFDGVKKLTVGADEYSVTYIKIEYEKDGKVITREHGTKRGEIKEFSVDYPKENITAVGGSFDHIFTYDTTLVTSLYFTLSNGFTSPKFGETKGTEFKLEGQNGGKLVGFYGRGEHAIDAIGAYFNNGSKPVGLGTKLGEGDSKPVDTGMKRPVGGSKGNTFDDGVFNGVKKVIVGVDEYSVTYIKIEYEMDGKVITREHGTKRGELKEFVVDYPKENITAVGGSYNHIFNYDTTLITSLYFTLSNGITSPKFGETSGTEFKLEDQNGEKLVGFYGRGDYAIDAIGGHFATGSSGSQKLEPQGGKGGSQKLEPQGGKGGNQWDDGADHEGVAKIYIAAGGQGIENIKFDYVKNGETKEGPFHGVKARGFISTFVINHPEEYLVSVEGWFDSTNIIQGIQFKTNRKTSNYDGYEFEGDGTQISLQVKDKKIIGFHGFADSHLNSLGAYFAPISSSSSLTSA